MKKLRIAIYSGTIPSTTFIENMVNAVAASGCEVYLFGTVRKKAQYAHPDIHVFATPVNRVRFILWLAWNNFRLRISSPAKYRMLGNMVRKKAKAGKLASLARSRYLPVMLHTPDVFHIQWAKGSAEWLPLRELPGLKLVLSLRGAHINYSPLADAALAASYRETFPMFDAFHAVSDTIALEAGKYGADAGRIRVVKSGIDTERIRMSTGKPRDHGSGKMLHLISVGRLHWKKGYPLAFEAVRKLMDAGFTIRYDLIAGGNNEEILYLVHDMNLAEQVFLHGSLLQEQVLEQMVKADLLLLPSVEEGIANVVLEAMALGLPVVSSDCGSMTEAITDGENGFLFRNRDVDDMVRVISECAELSPSRKEKLVRAARAKVESDFSFEKLGAGITGLYHDLCIGEGAS